jgi:asparagine synthase (glutamine-hydrolysing)
MLMALRHRGPDDEGCFQTTTVHGVLWFGHRRLAILDLSPAGHQPMSTADGQFTITFNGEIYNFQEVRAELEQAGYVFYSQTDTEVILYAWRHWGVNCLQRLRGMFAFALWDRDEQCLWLARDRLGEKPLYYAQQSRRFLFASEVRALLASGVIDRRMDSDGLDAYLTFGSVADPYTLVEGVRAVEAGCWVQIKDGMVISRPYWSLGDIPEQDNGVSQSQIVHNVGTLLRQSCRLCMVADVPVAILLSGGIDSSSNVVLLSEQDYTNLMTFSVIFEGPDIHYSEEQWSTLVAQRFQTQHHPVVVTDHQARAWVADAVCAMDQPSRDGVNTYIVCRAIRSAGVKVAITGQGSDEIFLGYWQRHLFPKLLGLAKMPLGWLSPLTQGLARLRALQDTRYEKLLQIIGAENALASAFLAQHTIFSQAGLERLRSTRRPPQTRFVNDHGGTTPLGKLSRLEVVYYLRNTLLRDGDQMSMANSLELRSPFVDYRLVETVSQLPGPLRSEPQSRQKPLLVDAVGPALPAELINRPKQGFELPYNRWLRAGLEVVDVVSTDIGLNKAMVKQVKEDFTGGRYWSRYWTLQALAAWVDRERITPPAA